jgi:large repetitive protein
LPPFAVNDPPVDGDEYRRVLEDEVVSGDLLANSEDPDTPRSGISVTNFTVSGSTYQAGATVVLPGVGSLTVLGNGAYTFAPETNFNGQVPLVDYRLTDGAGGYDASVLNITMGAGEARYWWSRQSGFMD